MITYFLLLPSSCQMVHGDKWVLQSLMGCDPMLGVQVEHAFKEGHKLPPVIHKDQKILWIDQELETKLMTAELVRCIDYHETEQEPVINSALNHTTQWRRLIFVRSSRTVMNGHQCSPAGKPFISANSSGV